MRRASFHFKCFRQCPYSPNYKEQYSAFQFNVHSSCKPLFTDDWDQRHRVGSVPGTGPGQSSSPGRRVSESGTAAIAVTCGSQKRANPSKTLGTVASPERPSPMPKLSLWFLLIYCSALGLFRVPLCLSHMLLYDSVNKRSSIPRFSLCVFSTQRNGKRPTECKYTVL